ncbi:MAG: RloB family protein, partial [Pantoea sp.]|nr:RloB family protein [Pantoea sp.]
MARDNSPKQRQQRQLERKQNRRASYDRILIVSEGSKTEPNYFREIRTIYRLHTANVEVRPIELGTAPIQVVQYAKE